MVQTLADNWESFEVYRSKQARGLLTGFKTIDTKLVGLPGLTTIMGEPKTYKSTFAMNIALNASLRGSPVILIDKENGIQRTRQRILSNLAKISYDAIRSKLTDEEQQAYKNARNTIAGLNFYYENMLGIVNPNEFLTELIQEIGRKHQQKVILIVDSLQSLVLDFKDRRGAVDFWVFLFNDLKLKFDGYLTIILISEKNRQAYGASNRAGAKESGGIEYKSEMLLDLYRTGENKIFLDCVFNRDGYTGIVTELEIPKPFYWQVEESNNLDDYVGDL